MAETKNTPTQQETLRSAEEVKNQERQHIIADTQKEIKKIDTLDTLVDSLKNLFADTPFGELLTDFFDLLSSVKTSGTDKEIQSFYQNNHKELFSKLSLGQLLIEEQRRPGFLAETFLRTPEGKYHTPTFQVGSQYKVDFAGHPAGKDLALTDIIPSTVGVSEITLTINGKNTPYRRILAGKEPMYVPMDSKGNPLKEGKAFRALPLTEGMVITIKKLTPPAQDRQNAEQLWQKGRLRDIDSKEQLTTKMQTEGRAQKEERTQSLTNIPNDIMKHAIAARAKIKAQYGTFRHKCFRVAQAFRNIHFKTYLNTAPVINFRNTPLKGITMEDYVRHPEFSKLRPGATVYVNMNPNADDNSLDMNLAPHWITYLGNGRWMDNTAGGENMSTTHMLQVLRGWGKGQAHKVHSIFPV
jgi:hypothetical protein